MQLKLVLSNQDGLAFVAALLQHFGIQPTEEWMTNAFAQAATPFVTMDLTGLRRTAVELAPRGWRDRLALLRAALS